MHVANCQAVGIVDRKVERRLIVSMHETVAIEQVNNTHRVGKTHLIVLYALPSVPGGSSSKIGFSRNPAANGSCPSFLKEPKIRKT